MLLQQGPVGKKAAAQMDGTSHENVRWLQIAVKAAPVVEELQPVQHAVQDMAHPSLREARGLQELAHVDLVEVAHESDVAVAARDTRIIAEEAHVDQPDEVRVQSQSSVSTNFLVGGPTGTRVPVQLDGIACALLGRRAICCRSLLANIYLAL